MTLLSTCLVGLAAWGLAPASRAGDQNHTLVVVNGEPITTLDLNALLASQPRPEPGKEVSSLSPDGVLQRLIENRLLEQEGYRTEAEKRPEIRNQVWDLRRHKGMMALLDSVSREARHADDSELVSALQQTATILRVSHILRRDEASAWAMIDSLRAGVPFAELADRQSQDTTSVIAPGGDLGWAREDRFIPEFAAALQEISPGQYSDPVETERGWHILMITDWRSETAGQNEEMETAILEAAKGDRVMKAIRAYVAGLMEKYDVRVDSTLLATLDYGSKDAQVSAELQSSESVVATLPWRQLTVRDLTMEIRFQHFHGLAGKPDAAALRDKALDEWLTELLLRHEASELGFDRAPALLVEAEAYERRLIREAVLNLVLDVEFNPTAEEVTAYYEANLEDFSSVPRFRVDGMVVRNEEVAQTVRRMLGDGARMSWLAANTPEVIDRKPEALAGWLQPEDLELGAAEIERGAFFGPTWMGDAWAVGEIVEVRASAPLPLESCRDRVLQAMKTDQMRSAVQSAVTQLRAGARIEFMDDAKERAAGRISAWLGRPADNP